MPTPIEAKTKAAQTYNAAADAYDLSANSFWDRFGRRTIDRLNPSSGARCLDVCCGSGASAIPTAKKVAPNGSVLGVDLAEGLLKLARAKATRQGIENIEFRAGDMLDLDLPDGHFDAVVCVFGIFFIPDMPGAVRELWRMVAPGGVLAITTWGPRFFEPANTAFWDAIAAVRPELYKGFNPWDRISDPATLRAMLKEGGVHDVQADSEIGIHAFARRKTGGLPFSGRATEGRLSSWSRPSVSRSARPISPLSVPMAWQRSKRMCSTRPQSSHEARAGSVPDHTREASRSICGFFFPLCT